jgi:uncharacterized protein
MRAMKKRVIFWGAVLLGLWLLLRWLNLPVGYALQMARINAVCGIAGYCHHVDDQAGFLPKDDIPRFESYMHHIRNESGVDLRFVFVKGAGEHSLEELAVELVEDRRIGGGTDDRGLLLLYDVAARRLKIEVGYGLEGMFPDAFINYLVTRHTQMFLGSGQVSVGLRLLLRLLQARIREAVLGEEFDPRVLDFIDKGRHLSGGAGVAARMEQEPGWRRGKLPPEERARYAAGATPFATYTSYLNWLNQPIRDADVDFLTPGSRSYLNSLPVSPAYGDMILMGEYGKGFDIAERGNLAILFFTGTPFTSPHFFVREGGKWRMDIVTEVRNTRELVGTYYTWVYTGRDDAYTRAFGDLLKPWGSTGYSRFVRGDNRPLVLSASARR